MLGINDVLGADPNGRPFDSKAFTTYDKWTDSPTPQKRPLLGDRCSSTHLHHHHRCRRAERHSGLSTVNGLAQLSRFAQRRNHSVPLAINIGITD